MATTQTRRTGSEQSAAPVPFSYAMAAKGLSSTGPSTAAQSKAASGSSTPSKDTNSASTVPPVASVASWADDTEAEHGKNEKPIQTQEDRPNVPPPSDPNTDNLPPPTSAVSSPDLGASSASTAVKEDDASSLQNALSESAWENKSQASTSVEKTSESGEKAEKLPAKPLYEAPVPAVNIWTKRLEDQKKVAPKPSGTKLANTVVSNGSSQGPSAFATKKTKGSDGVDVKEKATSVEGKFKSRDQERDSQPRREFGSGGDFDKTRKGSKGRSLEKDVKPAPAVLPLPPTRDQESWPTPDSAIDEDKKKTQDKVEKLEKERKDGAPSKPHSKWVSVPFTPTVIFNTPLPNAAASRRGGGRVGGRGGGANSGRGNGFGSNSVTNPEKDASTPSTLMNGDQPKRGRSDESTTRDASPGEKRPTSTGSTSLKEAKGLHSGAERSAKTGVAPETDPPSGRGTVLADTSSNTTGQNNSFPRQYPSGKPNKGRRGDIRKDGEIFSPTKENAGSHDRRTSTATQANDVDDHERRAPAFQDGQAASSKSGPNERRFSSLSGRDRGGRGGRGGRAGYQNGHHQFANGHAPPIQSSSTFPLARSPTNFQPEQGAYFPAPSGHGRNHRNGPRSQSVTNDNIYGRGSYGGHQQVPPIQTYNAPPVYDYGMMPPMNSAMPFSPFPVDQWTLLQLVSTQMEYYFSVENLCKDIFLRKHMDSQGFVFLSVLAGFNRIKQLTTDLDILKQVCHNSRTIEYLIGADGKDRLRKREDWKQWVMAVKERDVSAQNDGPEELHSPPVPHPLTFEQPSMHRYPDMSAGSPTGPVPFQPMNGFHPGDGPDAVALDHPLNGHANGVNGVNGFNGPNGQVNGINGYIGSNGHPIEATTNNAVSGEFDSFSDHQVETLSVIVRQQDGQPQHSNLPPSAIRTFSNGSIDSRNGMPNDPPTEPVSDGESEKTLLYWVKGKDAPVESLPPDSSYESYTHLRSKALEQRHISPFGSCPYDMDVLYQFWSHFLVRNFNTAMYQEFRQFAFEDSAERKSDIGFTNLLKYYGESLLSTHSPIRECVARDYVELVSNEFQSQRPAFNQLRSAWNNPRLDNENRNRLSRFLNPKLEASFE